MTYTPSDEILKKYADVIIKFALGSGEGIKKGDSVFLAVPESAKPLLVALQTAVLEAGGHPIVQFLADGLSKNFHENASDEQIAYVPDAYMSGRIESMDHLVRVLSDHVVGEMKDIDPKKLLARNKAMFPYVSKRREKEGRGELTRNLCLYGTPAMADEAGLSIEEYREQIIKACYLDEEDPIAKREETFELLERTRTRLSDMPIDYLHLEGEDADLKIKIGPDRKRLAGSGRNIPSFEIFTSPDWRGTEGRIRFNQPLYRYGNLIEGIELHFEDGLVTKATATKNQALLEEMINTENANKVGEYSITDKRTSRITKFMGNTLYDENVGGEFGNTHLAVGAAFKDSYTGDATGFTKEDRDNVGINDSAVHTDIMSTTDRTVTAYLEDGTSVVIYKDGMYQND